MSQYPDQNSLFLQIRTEIFFHLPPSYLLNIDEGIHNHLNKEYLLQYKESLNGTPICYNNINYSKDNCEILHENPFVHLKATVDFVVFCPFQGASLKFTVNKQSEDHVGGLAFGTFNVSVGASELAAYGYEWDSEQAAWIWQSESIQIGCELEVLVNKTRHGHGVLVIYGCFPSE